ncbi:MAG TPA: class II aldolase/adducin family protein [Chloroflexota bacterium]|jgi:ribulose-5-phosphate 4-epimerase/fuculose-1-phosphate aldolase
MATIPAVADPAVVRDLAERLVEAIQVLTLEEVLDGSGHLSARIPGTQTFCINPRFAGALADPEDICVVDLAGNVLAGQGPIPSETAIHAAVYRARPDVGSVLHCHPRFAILLGVQDCGLVPFHRGARLFEDGVPTFHDSRGIRIAAHADEMAATLGPHYALFLQGHGVVVVGPNVEANAVAAVRFEEACRDQLFLMSFTTPRPLDRKGPAGGNSGPRLENPYRAWPFLLYKHGLRPRAALKALARGKSPRNAPPNEQA